MDNRNMVDASDIQGLILRGYNFPYIRYIILTIKNKEGAQKLCADLASGSSSRLKVTNAELWENMVKPDYCLNIGFTYTGLEILIDESNCAAVQYASSAEVFASFKAGAVKDAKAMGDTGESSPEKWWKKGGWLLETDPEADGSDLHIQITLFALTSENREKYYLELLDMIPSKGVVPTVVPVYFKDSDPITVNGNSDYVHFGYRDSLSQPRIDDNLWNQPKVKMLMGISSVDDRPVVPVDRFVIRQPASDYNAHPLLINGTFAAFRLLYQDEAKFNKFIHSGYDAPELVAAKMCGRWRDGTPLVVSPDKEDKSMGEPSTKNFNFTNFNYLAPSSNQYGDQNSDELGLKCPYAAHIRRANPRDDTYVKDNDDNAQTHRILRRASPYGPVYDSNEEGEVQRGLVGLFIGAVLDFQFRFVTKAWLELGGFRNPDASDNKSGVDPLFGPQVGDDNLGDALFQYRVGDTYETVPNNPDGPKLTRFIRTDGSLYLFLPGIEGLKYLSKGMMPTSLAIS